MKPRKSTAILMTVWVATFVLYLFVKPDTPTKPQRPVLVNSVLSNHLSGPSEPPAR